MPRITRARTRSHKKKQYERPKLQGVDVVSFPKGTKYFKGVPRSSVEERRKFINDFSCPFPSFYTLDKEAADIYRSLYFDENSGRVYIFCAKKNLNLIKISSKTLSILNNELKNLPWMKDLNFMFGYGMSSFDQARRHREEIKSHGIDKYKLRKSFRTICKTDTTGLKRCSIYEIDKLALKQLCLWLKRNRPDIDGVFVPQMKTNFGDIFLEWHDETAFCCIRESLSAYCL